MPTSASTQTPKVEKDVIVCYLGFSIQVPWGARLGSKFAGTKLASLTFKVRKTLSNRKGVSSANTERYYRIKWE